MAEVRLQSIMLATTTRIMYEEMKMMAVLMKIVMVMNMLTILTDIGAGG